jgi:hypothetical protein
MAEQPSSTQPSRHHGWPGREETGLHRKKEEGAGLIPKNAEGDSATVTADAHLELLQIWLRDLEPYSNYRQRQTNSTPTVRWHLPSAASGPAWMSLVTVDTCGDLSIDMVFNC